MQNKNQSNTINIDGTEYRPEDLDQDQKKLFNKTSKWQAEALKLSEAFEDAQRLHQSYLFDLRTSLNNSKEK